MKSIKGHPLQPDARELILAADPKFFCETYIFEPTSREESLGYLFAVGEIEDRGGVGAELLNLVISAIQKEYYRDGARAAATSFELALHQANLILHDAAEQGVRDWMGYFHVAAAAQAGPTLHISLAGEASILLARKSHLTNISSGLAHSPVTNPLRTFSQVATGTLAARDTLFLGTHHFAELFRPEDLIRFAIDHSAATITTRMQQLYGDQGAQLPMSALVISLLPQYIVQPRQEVASLARPARPVAIHSASLKPRPPLLINRSAFKNAIMIIGRGLRLLWNQLRLRLWPYLKNAQRLATTSAPAAATNSIIRLLPSRQALVGEVKSWPARAWGQVRQWFERLPRTSKILAGATLLLAIALVVSVILLQQKRVRDAEIERASEILHQARTKTEAAASALVYNNRDQAQSFLAEAGQLAADLSVTNLYQPELATLQEQITTTRDRLQKIIRPRPESVRQVGNFAPQLSGQSSTHLFFVNDNLYTFNPANNNLLKMGQDGQVSTVSDNTQGIGFFSNGTVQAADKTINLLTNAPGVVIFDAKDATLHTQDIQFPSAKPQLAGVASFGNKLYLLDQTSKNIFVYSKTLRGYANPSPWITETSFPADTIRSFSIDGNIFTLHRDGTINRLFKGAPAEFTLEKVDPPLNEATALFTAENMHYLYILDPAHKRVVLVTKKGELANQIFLDNTQTLTDIAIDPDTNTLYALDGTRVLAISLEEN